MSPDTVFLERMVDTLGWALLHSLWQGAAVAVGAAIALALLARQSAVARYWVAYGALGLTLVLPVATAWQLAEAAPAASAAASARAVPAAAPLPVSFVDPLLFWTGVSRLLDAVVPWLVVAWLAGVLVMSIRFAGGFTVVRGLGHRGAAPPPETWRRRFGHLVERLAITRPVRLLTSVRVSVPTVCGWLKPVVLVPLGTLTALPADQVESILAHELAHVRRHDYLMNLVQSVIEVLLFFHPGVWWLSKRVRAERENCCDDVAVELSGDARIYVRALASLAERRTEGSPSLALAATGSPLVARLRRLVTPRDTPPGEAGSRLAASIFLLSLTLALATGVAPRVEAAAAVSVLGLDSGPRLYTTSFGYREESLVAESCDPTEETVRCVDTSGQVRLECGPKPPFTLLWQSVRGRGEDDEVRVVVSRKGPGASREPAPAPPPTEAPGAEAPKTEKLVITADLPRCDTT